MRGAPEAVQKQNAFFRTKSKRLNIPLDTSSCMEKWHILILLVLGGAVLFGCTQTGNGGGTINSDTNIFIKKTNVPGFVINPTEVTTTIDNNGYYEIVTSEYLRSGGDTNITYQRGNLSRAQVEELALMLLESNYFDLNQETDVMMCIADLPTVTLEATVANKSNYITSINAECDRNKLVKTKAVIKKIDELTGQKAQWSIDS